jgi:hypothetical protein
MYYFFYLVGSAFLFLLLPDIDQKQTDAISVLGESKKIINLIKNTQYTYLYLYYYFPGVIVAFYATYLYKIVKASLPAQ